MRKVLRNKNTLDYWNNRWSSFDSDEDEFHNLNIYPVKYVDPVMQRGYFTLDAGCGLGRVVKHYKKKGFDIVGCDYSEIAVNKLNKANPELDIRQANIVDLPYTNNQFDNILALGLFHSIENLADIRKGILETVRCLKNNGHMVVSVRADNLENRLIDYISERRGMKGDCFHKWCFSRDEFIEILEQSGLAVEKCELITNVSFLHKFGTFQKRKNVNEKSARSKGFELNMFGSIIYNILKLILPNSFGTTLVFTTKKQGLEAPNRI
jgi:SAM-dependent methyltransferase